MISTAVKRNKYGYNVVPLDYLQEDLDALVVVAETLVDRGFALGEVVIDGVGTCIDVLFGTTEYYL